MELQSECCQGGVLGQLRVLTLVLLLLQPAAAQNTGANCGRPCVPIRQCSRLASLLNNPTIQNIHTLRQATCRVANRQPLVCCPPTSLLPRKCGRTYKLNRIHGGNETTIGSNPWMAALGYTEPGFPGIKYLCGGSIINNRYILTAAHCLHPRQLGAKQLELVSLGDWDLSTNLDCDRTMQPSISICAPPAQNYTIESIILHPSYNTRASYSDDIALIRVSRPINLNTVWIHPVCLPPANLNARQISGLRQPEVAGWGFTENGTTSDRMLSVSLPFVDKAACNVTYRGHLIDEQLCLGGVLGQDSCGGDSGGPLVVQGPLGPPYLQIGVVSYGPAQCGQLNLPGVYTSTSHYRNWIEENIRE